MLRKTILSLVLLLFSVSVSNADSEGVAQNTVILRCSLESKKGDIELDALDSGVVTISKGTVLKVKKEYQDSYEVSYGALRGWVDKSAIKLLGEDVPLKYSVVESDKSIEEVYDIQNERAKVGGNVVDAKISRGKLEEGAKGYVSATIEDIEYYSNPSNFVNTTKGMMQFLRIDSYKGGVDVDELNRILNKLPSDGKKKNVFYNKGKVFIESAKKYDIDLAYLVSHALWETGRGTSTLAKGQVVDNYKGFALKRPLKVYNFYGIGAIDGSANVSGKEASYSNGWTSVKKTIEGSAKWLSENYIHSKKYGQNTLYKMKFNNDVSWHQYATDVNWANGITDTMLKIVNLYDNTNNLEFEIPLYKPKTKEDVDSNSATKIEEEGVDAIEDNI